MKPFGAILRARCQAAPPKITSRIDKQNLLACGLVSLSVTLCACGEASKAPVNSVAVTGQWEITGQSESTPGKTTVLEVNLAKDSADTLFATPDSVLALQQTTSLNDEIVLNSVGFTCDNDVVGNNAFNATFTTNTAATFAITDNGALGSESPTGSFVFNSEGTQITAGSYNVPPACGAPEDSGSITGTKIAPFNGSYGGTFNSGADTVVVTVTEDPSKYSVQVFGTYNGAPVSLGGRAIGGTFLASGQAVTGPLSLLGVYDPAVNDFVVYGATTLDFLGRLSAGTKP
jgi:hypothetical protein